MLENCSVVSDDRISDRVRETIGDHSNKSARKIHEKDTRRSLSKIKENAFKGWKCKAIAAIARGLDPLEVLDFSPKQGDDKYKNFLDINGETFDVKHAVIKEADQPGNGNIVFSLHTKTVETLINKFEMGRKYGRGYDPDYIELIYESERDGLFYHIGLIETGGLGCDKFPSNFEPSEDGQRQVFELKIADEKKDGLNVLESPVE